MALLRTVNRSLPRFVRHFPFNVLLWDVDRRIRTGRPLLQYPLPTTRRQVDNDNHIH
jgi:hypothetical protein